LGEEEVNQMRQLGILAKEKLNGKLIHNPHRKQENLHLLIFSKLDNDIFMSLMEIYWKIYEGGRISFI